MKNPARAILASALVCGAAQAAELTVTITDIREPAGHLLIAVVDSAAAWDNQAKPVARRKVPTAADAVTLKFPDLPAGTYAVQVAHDENDNGQLDRNVLGIPTEGYGFSNNPHVPRRPRFDEASFVLSDADVTLTISLR